MASFNARVKANAIGWAVETAKGHIVGVHPALKVGLESTDGTSEDLSRLSDAIGNLMAADSRCSIRLKDDGMEGYRAPLEVNFFCDISGVQVARKRKDDDVIPVLKVSLQTPGDFEGLAVTCELVSRLMMLNQESVEVCLTLEQSRIE